MTKGHFNQKNKQNKTTQKQKTIKYSLLFIHISISFNRFQKAFLQMCYFSMDIQSRVILMGVCSWLTVDIFTLK